MAVIALWGAALVLGGCGGGGGSATSNSISGYVRDGGSLEPVGGARVATGSGETTTNAQGYFLLQNVSSGAVTLSVTASGYLAATRNVPSGSGERFLDVPIYLTPAPVNNAGNITGVITRGGQVEADASVRAGGSSAVSAADGTYTLYNVPQGFQTVFATAADNLTGGSASVTVVAGQTITANISLSTQPPPPPITD